MIRSLRPSRRLVALAAIVAVALTIAGCGRRGDPLPPPDASAPSPAATNSVAQKSVLEPGGGYSSEKATPVKPKAQPFVLDPVLN